MAWNPSPKVATAREFGIRFKYDKVIIIGVNESDGKFEVVSYGETKRKCAEAEITAGHIYELIKNGEINF